MRPSSVAPCIRVLRAKYVMTSSSLLGGNTTFQSFFMSTTVQPFCLGLVESLVELADVRVAVVGPFALGIRVMHEAHEASAGSRGRPLEHLLVAIGVAEGEDGLRCPMKRLMPTGLPGPSSTNSTLASFMSSGLPSAPISNLTTPDEPTTCSGGMP